MRTVTEIKVKSKDKMLQQAVDTFAKSQLKIQDLKKKIKGFEKELKEARNIIEPVLTDLEDVTLQTESYIVKITKAEFDKMAVSYSDLFKEALTKVNTATQKVLLDLQEELEHSVTVVAKIDASKKESFLKSLYDKLAEIIDRIKKKVSEWMGYIRDIDSANRDMETVMRQTESVGRQERMKVIKEGMFDRDVLDAYAIALDVLSEIFKRKDPSDISDSFEFTVPSGYFFKFDTEKYNIGHWDWRFIPEGEKEWDRATDMMNQQGVEGYWVPGDNPYILWSKR